MTEKLDREALVEKAARAIYEVDPALVKGVRLAWDFEHFDAWVVREVWLRKARAALAVFEEAHTPTDDRMVIYANSNVTRGKFAAAAVHAALKAVGAHHGGPVIVLGAKPPEIAKHATVIRDAGKTEVDPGTVTAGTDWAASPEPLARLRDALGEGQVIETEPCYDCGRTDGGCDRIVDLS